MFRMLPLCLALMGPALLAEPPKSSIVRTDGSTASIADLVAKIKDLRAQQAALAKQEAETTAALKVALKAQQDMLDELNIKPAPPPNPIDNELIPFTGKWRIVIIEETADAATARGQFFSNDELWKYVAAKCVKKPRIADQNAKAANGKPPTDLVPYLDRAKGKKLPQAYIISETGDVLFEGDLPATPELFLALLRKIGG